MPKLGMEPIRRQQLIDATISAISQHGFADTTVARIARAASVSAGIIHHYFGGKNELLEAAMRAILQDLHRELNARLTGLGDPRARLYAIIDGNFTEAQFAPQAIQAWLAFWSQSPYVPSLRRLQHINARRLRSNLLHALGQLQSRPAAEATATGMALLIDGLSLHGALSRGGIDAGAARRMLREYLDMRLDGTTHSNQGDP